VSVDRASFVALMVDMAIEDFRAPEQALLPAFESLDTDGDGSVTQVSRLRGLGLGLGRVRVRVRFRG